MLTKKKRNKLKGIYAKVPKSQCKGLCVDSCGPIGMTKGEHDILLEKTGKEPAINHNGNCIYLIEGKCSVYNDRPLICRLFGHVEKLKCPYGCQPQMLTQKQADQLISESEKLTGDGEIHFSNLPIKLF